jgi:hypothetical protein
MVFDIGTRAPIGIGRSANFSQNIPTQGVFSLPSLLSAVIERTLDEGIRRLACKLLALPANQLLRTALGAPCGTQFTRAPVLALNFGVRSVTSGRNRGNTL